VGSEFFCVSNPKTLVARRKTIFSSARFTAMNASMQTAEPASAPVRQAALLAYCHLRLYLVHDIQVLHHPMNKIVPLIVQGFSNVLFPIV
jgi:hypothetical protein